MHPPPMCCVCQHAGRHTWAASLELPSQPSSRSPDTSIAAPAHSAASCAAPALHLRYPVQPAMAAHTAGSEGAWRRLGRAFYLRWPMPLRLGRSRRPHLHTSTVRLTGGGGAHFSQVPCSLGGGLAVDDGMAMHFRCITINLSSRIGSGACSSEQERRSCPHYRRHCEVVVE